MRLFPALRRLCGWESASAVPNQSTFSRAFRDFANDRLAVDVHAEFVRKALGRNGAFHVDAVTRRHSVRSGIERVFSYLHEAHGGKFVRVRGRAKVLLHLMFGLIVIAAEQVYTDGMLT